MNQQIDFRTRLKQGLILTDGAMGTYLHTQGADIGGCFDELNLSQPALVFETHRAYLDAGAEIIETNTFGANRYKLSTYALDNKVKEINTQGVQIARQAVEAAFRPNLYVAGSVGPLGVQLAPFGRVSTDQAYQAFQEQIEALIETGVDLLILETFSDLYEVREAVRAARDIDGEIPIVVQITFTRDDRTLLGDSPEQVAGLLADLNVDVVGVNCSNGPVQITRIIKKMQPLLSDIPLSVMPNAGWPENVGGRVMYPAMPDYFADYAVAFREQGIGLLGGCCGTTPDHIAAMRAALDDPSYSHRVESGVYLVESHEEETEESAPSQLAGKLARGEFVIAVEMSPPKGIAVEKVIRAAQMLTGSGADVIDVLDSPMARMRMSPWGICQILQQRGGIESVLHFPTRGRNLLRVQGDLLAAHAVGVRNLFVVMGDPTHIGDYPDAADNYDIVPSGLVRLIKQHLNKGRDWAGNKIGQPTNFLVSCALNLNAPKLDREIRVLRKKMDGGADYLLTQPIFDIATYDRFVARYEELHGTLDIPILAGLMPLYGVRHAKFLHNEVPGIVIPEKVMKRMEDAGDQAPQEGVRIAQELAEKLQGSVAGLYLLPQFRRYDLVAEIIESVSEKG